MKLILKIMALSLIFMSFIYLIFAFASWNIDAGKWSEFSRFMCTVIFGLILVGVLKGVSDNIEENK